MFAHEYRDGAEIVFPEHGFGDVTVEHIADVADIGKGTIYNYFDTKEDIVVAFMVDVERKVQAERPSVRILIQKNWKHFFRSLSSFSSPQAAVSRVCERCF